MPFVAILTKENYFVIGQSWTEEILFSENENEENFGQRDAKWVISF